MLFEKGNQFWNNRSEHGKDKLFASPDLLWEAACQYFQWCIDNPWIKNEAIKSGENAGQLIEIPTSRPFTLIGLCLYVGCSESYFRMFEKNNKSDDKADYITVLTRIEETIRNNKYEGGMVGAYNPAIVMRDLGLVDRTDHTTKNLPINSTGLEHLTFEQLKELANDTSPSE